MRRLNNFVRPNFDLILNSLDDFIQIMTRKNEQKILSLAASCDDGSECFICMDNDVEFQLSCTHKYCRKCLIDIYYHHEECCAFCRRSFA